jgi:hypothetical protein
MIYLAFVLWLPEQVLLRTKTKARLVCMLPPKLAQRLAA